jgi:hypothetical protein
LFVFHPLPVTTNIKIYPVYPDCTVVFKYDGCVLFGMKVSVVIPVKNEERNVAILHKRLMETGSYEIIFIDDGSTDLIFS